MPTFLMRTYLGCGDCMTFVLSETHEAKLLGVQRVKKGARPNGDDNL